MNNWVSTGRLTKDAECRYSNDGKCVAKFDLAVNRKFKRDGEPDADFFTCVAFGKIAETIDKLSIGKGTKLLVEGEVRNNNYTNKDGQKVYGTQIVVNSFEFCESKQTGEAAPAQKAAPKNEGSFMEIPDTWEQELPFN